ncbi:MAG: dihydrodipicolinate synthase family protein, partial [Gammaproteobacteria bacterium]
MERQTARDHLCGCYVTIPTMFRDEDLEVDLPAIRRHVRFLIEGGITTGTGVLLTGGAAGDFSTMTFDERIQVAGAVVEEANGRVPVVIGAQTTSTRELVRLARAAERLGAEFVQVSPPFYFAHTEEDFYEHVAAVADVNVSLVIYNTYWTSYGVSTEMVERLGQLPNVVGLKWSMPDKGNMEFEQVVSRFSKQFSIIDNQM